MQTALEQYQAITGTDVELWPTLDSNTRSRKVPEVNGAGHRAGSGGGTDMLARDASALLLWHPQSLSPSAAVRRGSNAAQKARLHINTNPHRCGSSKKFFLGKHCCSPLSGAEFFCFWNPLWFECRTLWGGIYFIYGSSSMFSSGSVECMSCLLG